MRFNKFNSYCQIAILTSVILLSMGCNTGTSYRTPPSPGEGFVAFDSPRDFDAPGQIYRIDRNKTLWRVGSIDVAVKTGNEQSRTIESKANWSLNTMLKMVGVAASQVPASAQVEASRSREVTIDGTGVTREFIEDTQQPAEKVAKLLAGTEYRADNKYYLIRETESVVSLNFKGSRQWMVDAGAQADIQKALSGKAEFKFDNSDTYSITAKFDHPMRVWYKAERVEPKFGSNRTNPGSLQLDLAPAAPGELKIPAKKIATKP